MWCIIWEVDGLDKCWCLPSQYKVEIQVFHAVHSTGQQIHFCTALPNSLRRHFLKFHLWDGFVNRSLLVLLICYLFATIIFWVCVAWSQSYALTLASWCNQWCLHGFHLLVGVQSAHGLIKIAVTQSYYLNFLLLWDNWQPGSAKQDTPSCSVAGIGASLS